MDELPAFNGDRDGSGDLRAAQQRREIALFTARVAGAETQGRIAGDQDSPVLPFDHGGPSPTSPLGFQLIEFEFDDDHAAVGSSPGEEQSGPAAYCSPGIIDTGAAAARLAIIFAKGEILAKKAHRCVGVAGAYRIPIGCQQENGRCPGCIGELGKLCIERLACAWRIIHGSQHVDIVRQQRRQKPVSRNFAFQQRGAQLCFGCHT